MLSATIIAIVWFIGGKVSALPLFSFDALWPSFGVSTVLYVVICLAHRQTPEELGVRLVGRDDVLLTPHRGTVYHRAGRPWASGAFCG